MMEEKKIQLTKELIIKNYKRALLGSYFTDYLTLAPFIVLYALLFNPTRKNGFGFVAINLLLAFCILVIFCTEIGSILTLVRVLRSEFRITTDILVKREKTRMKIRWRYFYTVPAKFEFEKYGTFLLNNEYFSLRGRYVSKNKQIEEAYLGDVYYVVLLKKGGKIVSVFNSRYYEYEQPGKP